MGDGFFTSPTEILLVEDNPADVLLLEEALSTLPVPYRLHVVEDGEVAMDFMHRRPPYENVRTPKLVVLDLNLPRMSGHEVLEALKNDPRFRRTPVIILTTSDAEEDVYRTYDHHANCYIRKPVGYSAFKKMVAAFERFWMTLVKLPAVAHEETGESTVTGLVFARDPDDEDR